jgi:hypothetical protein
VAALEAGERKSLQSLADEFHKLPPEARRDLPVRIREESVEFAFRGEFPGDQSPWQMLEYLACGSGKDYESLLVVPEAERKRLAALRRTFGKRAGEGRREWSARLVWADGATPQSVDLTDLLIRVPPEERARFLDGLRITGAGLGGDINVQADPATLPHRRVAALLLLTIRIAPGG